MWPEEHTHGGRRAPGAYSLCCGKGRIRLPPLQAPPELLRQLFARELPGAATFLQHIRAYNVQLQMASTGVAIEGHEPHSGPCAYKIGGVPHHKT